MATQRRACYGQAAVTPSVRHVIAATQVALLGGPLVVAGLLAVRRLVDGLSVPLSTAILAATGAAFAAACLAGRLLGPRSLQPAYPSWLWLAARIVPLAACGL